MLERMKEIQEIINSVKSAFTAKITDKSIPLNESWELFVSAPDYYKESESYIVCFDSLDEDDVGYDGNLYYVARGQVVHTSHIAEAMLEEEYSANEYDAFREEVLSMNLGSYRYDW